MPESYIDALGHVNNVKWLEIVVALAGDHSIALGFDMVKLREVGGYWVVRKHEIEYIRPAFAGQTLVEETWIAQVAGIRNYREYRIYEKTSAQLCVRARSEWVFTDCDSGRPKRVPAIFKTSYPVRPEGATDILFGQG